MKADRLSAALAVVAAERTAQRAAEGDSLPEPAFTLRWDDNSGQYKVSKPGITYAVCYTAEGMLAALASKVQPKGTEPQISTEHGPWLPSRHDEGESYCQRCLTRSIFADKRVCDPHIVQAPAPSPDVLGALAEQVQELIAKPSDILAPEYATALREMATHYDMSEMNVLRAAIRLYQAQRHGSIEIVHKRESMLMEAPAVQAPAVAHRALTDLAREVVGGVAGESGLDAKALRRLADAAIGKGTLLGHEKEAIASALQQYARLMRMANAALEPRHG